MHSALLKNRRHPHSAFRVRCTIGAMALFLGVAPNAHAQGDVTARLYRDSYALEAKRDYAGALAKVRDAKKAGTNAYFAAVRMGWLSYLAGDYTTAVAMYTEAASAEPKAVEPKLGRSLALLAIGNWRELERASREVLAIDTENVTALSRLAIAQYNNGNFADAAATYRKLTESYPSDLDFKTGLGWALLKGGRTAEARPLFAAVLAVSPDNLNALKGLGRN